MNNISINALIARLFVYGLVALADEVKNAATVEITDLSHFNVLDENGCGNQYVIEGDDETTVAYGKLLEPDGGTIWQFRDQPDYEAETPKTPKGNIAKFAVLRHGSDNTPAYFDTFDKAKRYADKKIKHFQYKEETTEAWSMNPEYSVSGYNDPDEDGYVASLTYSVVAM